MRKKRESFREVPSSLDPPYPILKPTDALNADGDSISFCQGKVIGRNAGFGHQKAANGKGIGTILTYDESKFIRSETNDADGVLVGPIQN